jgi:hypothetical protein
MRKRGLWALLVTTLIAVAAAACGGGGDSNKTPTAGPTVASTPGTSLTPFATPQVSGTHIDSLKGYSADFPAGWHVRANFINTADATVDAFFEPLDPAPAPGVSPVQASITVTCVLVVAPAADFAAGRATMTAQLAQNQGIQMSKVTIAGIAADVISYRNQSAQNPDQPAVDKQDILFTGGKCNWTVTTTTRAGDRPKYQPLFDAFVASFKLK